MTIETELPAVKVDIVDRLREACNGHPAAKIAWPHRVLHEAADEIAALRARCEKAEAELKYESDRGDEWLEKATYEVGGVPQLWSARATAAESRCEELDRRIAETRAAALEEAIDAVKRCADPSTFVMTGPAGILRQAAAAIRALIPEREG